eukprot:CAMPEP_0113878500 /NCGR_PEP_ID=MMETSP0780_2-20120614/6724_1 /TAXON_ID=652834 /ORGANISM="Palpitomonas bilix" /LENGTH=142 /DNA_ID=CAMNT_0000864991 /DNA_START=243 /DNA_END=668 /DNA_ORIENTATION=+ /assembly_acc=CAM_ASM_000599
MSMYRRQRRVSIATIVTEELDEKAGWAGSTTEEDAEKNGSPSPALRRRGSSVMMKEIDIGVSEEDSVNKLISHLVQIPAHRRRRASIAAVDNVEILRGLDRNAREEDKEDARLGRPASSLEDNMGGGGNRVSPRLARVHEVT